jgi:hypothetical protein
LTAKVSTVAIFMNLLRDRWRDCHHRVGDTRRQLRNKAFNFSGFP